MIHFCFEKLQKSDVPQWMVRTKQKQGDEARQLDIKDPSRIWVLWFCVPSFPKTSQVPPQESCPTKKTVNTKDSKPKTTN